jgi:hypothetical protein
LFVQLGNQSRGGRLPINAPPDDPLNGVELVAMIEQMISAGV